MHDHRAALINGLLDLAAFLEGNPKIPVSKGTLNINAFPEGDTDDEMCAEIDRVAALLGTEIDPDHRPYGHYHTGLDFGPVRYAYTAILAPARARHAADDSYRGCITPDTPANATHEG